MELVAKMGISAWTATDTNGTRSSQKTKTDAMSVDCKERKKERIEDQLIKQSIAMRQEAEENIPQSQEKSKHGFSNNTHSDQGRSNQTYHNPKNKEDTDQNHQIEEDLEKRKNHHKIPT